MKPIRIRHGNPSHGITPQARGRAEMGPKGESVMNPSRLSVTDSERQKAREYIKKHTLSPFLIKSVTYPPARGVRVCTRIREGCVTDLRDGFEKEDGHARAM